MASRPPEPTSSIVLKQQGPRGQELAFEECCKCFEELAKPHSDRHLKPKQMRRLWDSYGTKDFFELMRLILPNLDTVRPQYRVKQKMLARMYVELLALNESSEDAQSLLNWKRPANGFQRNEQGNFPEVVLSVIEHRSQKRSDINGLLTIRELNRLLDQLADVEGFEKKKEVMRQLERRTTAREQRWILRIILKDMQIGMKEDSVFKILHPDARELYNSVCDLKATCEKCIDPEYRHDAISICIFKALRPRLAARSDWRDVHKILSRKGDYVAEHKLDGERLMLHFRRGQNGGNDHAEWYTRNCKNFSGNYGEPMGPVLRQCLKPELTECILDGEMMVWNNATGDYAAFGENRGLGDYKKRIDAEQQPCYVVFDCLWINGECIDKKPLWERRQRIEKLVNWVDHYMELSRATVVKPGIGAAESATDPKSAVMYHLDAAMAKGYEGVVFKSLDSNYTAGARDNDWMKLKPDYVHDMGDELDLLIIAGYYGEGNRRGGAISHFLLGLQAPASEKHKHPNVEHPRFYPFCKVGTGYSQQKLADLREQLKPGQHKWHRHQRPAHLCGWTPSKTDDEPDVWFEPAKSVIMSVAAYEMVTGDSFLPCGYTLRFPRCTTFRLDKSWHECETFDEVLRRAQDGKAKIAASKRTAADVAAANPDDLEYGGAGGKRSKKAMGAAGSSRGVGVLAHLCLDVSALKAAQAATEAGQDWLKGTVAVVLGSIWDAAHPSYPATLQKLLAAHGAEVHANMSQLVTLLVVADDLPGAHAQSEVDRARRDKPAGLDIVNSAWLIDSHEAGRRLELEPRYLLYARPDTEQEMLLAMDPWGDRYREPATLATLGQSAALVQRTPPSRPPDDLADGRPCSALVPIDTQHGKPVAPPSSEDWVASDFRLLPEADAGTLRRGITCALLGVVAYSPRAAMRLRLRILGAKPLAEPAAGVTHAVLPEASVMDGMCAKVRGDLTRARVAAADVDAGISPWIVSEAWVAECECRGAHAAEQPFALRECADSMPNVNALPAHG